MCRASEPHGGQRLLGRHVPRAGQDDIRRLPLRRGAGPLPHPRTGRAVLVGLGHRQVLQVLLLVHDDEVDMVGAAQAVVGDGHGRVGVRREPDPHDVRASGMRQSMSPGPWWLNPLWSLRQQVEVSRMLSESFTDARHGSDCACCSHLVCWIAIDAETIANAS